MLSTIRRSLHTKVVMIVLATTFVALVVSTLTLLSYEASNYGQFLVTDATTQAGILSRVSAPTLAFDDPETAKTNLELLSNRPGIRAAAIYGPDGSLFASYSRTPNLAFPPLGEPGVQIEGTTLTLFRPIVQNGDVLGTVYLQATYDRASRVHDYLVILVAVMLVSLLVALVVSLWLAGGVTNPVQAITAVARKVIERRDFTLRARRTTEDEIGVLVDAFNTMLGEVGERTSALEASNRALQQETNERRHAESVLRRADQHKDQFLATLAHELRNPLAPMVSALALLETSRADPATAARARDILSRQLGQMVRLVDDLLDVSRITRGKLTMRKAPTRLATIVENAVDTARPVLEQGGQTLSVDLPEQAVFLEADAVRLSQVFANLLNNAAKYSERGGSVSLTAIVTGTTLRVRIDDQGLGMTPKTLHRIFTMFSRGDDTVERPRAGLGVGLALAKRLIELHGGTIQAHSPGLGKGSSFTVELPVLASKPPEHPPPHGDETPCGKRRILLVDDNVDFATSLSMLLQNLGHEVRIAHDAQEALAVAGEFQPEFGFVDLGLPKISGYEVARTLRTQPETAGITLIAVSGWGQASDRERSRQAGFTLHLVKPVELRSIQAAMARLAAEH